MSHLGTPTRFAKYVDGHLPMAEELPLVHSTRCESLSSIAQSRSLIPQLCRVFNEPLLYLFYGRPAYGTKGGEQPSTSIAYCPVCLVFKPHTISSEIVRVFPFDSGASKLGKFEPHVSAKESDNFALSPALTSARRITKAFFESNERYYVGEATPNLNIPATESEAGSYYQLLASDGEATYDDRRSAIELQVNTALTLRDTLLAVILPLSFLQEPGIRKAIVEDWRTYPITYSTVRGTIPSEYRRVIAEKLRGHLKNGGYL